MKQLQEAIAQFQINEPIKSLFQPRFELCDDFMRGGIIIRLHCTAPDSLGSSQPTEVIITELLIETTVRQFIHEPLQLAKLLRGLLHKLLLHEADESIVWQGERVFDPHRGEK